MARGCLETCGGDDEGADDVDDGVSQSVGVDPRIRRAQSNQHHPKFQNGPKHSQTVPSIKSSINYTRVRTRPVCWGAGTAGMKALATARQLRDSRALLRSILPPC